MIQPPGDGARRLGAPDGSDPVDISIVVPCRNGAGSLRGALESLVGHRWRLRWEIVLADNGSTDATCEVFAAFGAAHPELATRVIDASARPGKASALNVALSGLPSRAFLFLDDDDAVAPGWLEAMGEALESEPLVAARVDTLRLSPEWASAAGGRDGRGLALLWFPPHCALAGGSTLGFRREVFATVGPFDREFMAVEDSDFLIRAYRKGYRLIEVPDAVYHYRLRSTPEGVARQEWAYTRYGARLRRLYDPGVRSVFAPRPWLWLAGSLLGLGLDRCLRAAGVRRPGTPAREAGRAWWSARVHGELSGALAERIAPRPPRKAAARRRRFAVRKPAGAAAPNRLPPELPAEQPDDRPLTARKKVASHFPA